MFNVYQNSLPTAMQIQWYKSRTISHNNVALNQRSISIQYGNLTCIYKLQT